jgi:diguanylate cyclase (GGDEF)-like protein/PAS domain S-box-containing protein
MNAMDVRIDWQALLGVAAESLAEGILVYDDEGRVVASNASARRLLGDAPLDDDRDPALSVLRDGRARSGVRVAVERSDGTLAWLSVNAVPLRHDDDDAPYAVLCSFVDVSTEVAAQERFRALFEAAPIGMAEIALDGRLLEANGALCEILGRERGAIEGVSLWSFVHADDGEHDERVRRDLGEGRVGRLSLERRLERGDGGEVWAQLDISVVASGRRPASSAILQVQDISERRRTEARMRHLADHDALTGLLNRRAFGEVLERHVAGIRRYGATGAVLLLDVDSFKDVNDTLGHRVGDDVLRALAALLRERVRETDALARLGGDEFAVLLSRAHRAEALSVARDIVALVRERIPLPAAAGRPSVTVSVGVAVFADEVRGAEQIMVDADMAMYAAKADGRNRAAVYAAS